jgi:hypothetical protein
MPAIVRAPARETKTAAVQPGQLHHYRWSRLHMIDSAPRYAPNAMKNPLSPIASIAPRTRVPTNSLSITKAPQSTAAANHQNSISLFVNMALSHP